MYRRHTNFAIESIEQTFNGAVGFGRKVTCTVSRNGDLVADVYLQLQLTKTGDTFYPAEQFIDEVELEIGGQRVDRHTADWFRMYDNLFRAGDEREQYRRMTDFIDGESVGTTKTLYVPLLFSFCRNPGLALPLIALQYHEVRLNFQFAKAGTIPGVESTASTDPKASCWIDYVYLDVDERRRFAQSSHEYLIEQVQYPGPEPVSIDANSKTPKPLRLNLNHPCKFLAWNVRHDTQHGLYTGADPTDVANIGTYKEALAPLYQAHLSLNGHDRFQARAGSYFNVVQPFQTLKTKPAAGVYMYSFCMRPNEHQPSGSLNMSRIDQATLHLVFRQANVVTSGNSIAAIQDEEHTSTNCQDLKFLRVYAVNYNVLRIMSGMGGLAFLRKIVPKSRAPRPSGLWTGTNSLAPPGRFIAAAPTASGPHTYCIRLSVRCREARETAGCGKPLRAFGTKRSPERAAWRTNKSGTVTTRRIGQSAGYSLRAPVKPTRNLQRSLSSWGAVTGRTTRAPLRYDPAGAERCRSNRQQLSSQTPMHHVIHSARALLRSAYFSGFLTKKYREIRLEHVT